MLDPRAIHIRTDGSCYKNPGGQSGCAATIHYPDHVNRPDEQIVDFGCAESAIGRMELMACLRALRWVIESAPWPDVTRILIISDSDYVTANINRAPSWKKAGWRNRHGEPKFNDDLWDGLLKAHAKIAKSAIRVDFVWERGKSSPAAKVVHNAARTAALRGGFDVDRGYRPGGVSRSMVKGGRAAERFNASGQVLVIRPYVKKIMAGGENRISFNIFDEATQAYHGKWFVFAPASLASDLHLGNGHRVRFNAAPDYPQIIERLEAVSLPKPGRRTLRPGDISLLSETVLP